MTTNQNKVHLSLTQLPFNVRTGQQCHRNGTPYRVNLSVARHIAENTRDTNATQLGMREDHVEHHRKRQKAEVNLRQVHRHGKLRWKHLSEAKRV